MRSVFLTILSQLIANMARAEEADLPKELLLKCEIRDYTATTIGGKQDVNTDRLVKHFRLKDGTFSYTSGYIPLGVDCLLHNGEVLCKFKTTKTSKTAQLGTHTERRESYVTLARLTGELRVNINIELYNGEGAKGAPIFKMTSIQEGICRPITKPIF